MNRFPNKTYLLIHTSSNEKWIGSLPKITQKLVWTPVREFVISETKIKHISCFSVPHQSRFFRVWFEGGEGDIVFDGDFVWLRRGWNQSHTRTLPHLIPICLQLHILQRSPISISLSPYSLSFAYPPLSNLSCSSDWNRRTYISSVDTKHKTWKTLNEKHNTT